jgi:hypothetical protein
MESFNGHFKGESESLFHNAANIWPDFDNPKPGHTRTPFRWDRGSRKRQKAVKLGSGSWSV